MGDSADRRSYSPVERPDCGAEGDAVDELATSILPDRGSSRLDRVRRSLRRWAPLALLGTGISVGVLVLGRRTALGHWVGPPKERHSNSSDYLGLQELFFPDFGEQYDDPNFRIEGEPLVQRRFDQGRCVANILAGSFHLADVSVTSIAASQDCPLAATGEVQTFPLRSAKTALLDLEKLVKNAQQDLHNSQGIAQIAAVMQQAAKFNTTLEQLDDGVDEAQNALSQVVTPPPAQGPDSAIDLYSVKRQAELRCARDALIIVRASAAASAKLSVASGACPEEGHKPRGARCSAQVSAALSTVALLGTDIDRMVINCRPGFYDMTRCVFRLEGLSWQIAAAARFLSGAIRVCQKLDPNHERSMIKKFHDNGFRDFGWCIGEIFSTMGYAGTTAMWIYNGARWDCENARRLMWLNRTLTQREEQRLVFFRGRCVADYASAVRTLFLTFTKGVRSYAHCGDYKENCPRDILRAVSAMAGVAEAGARIYAQCHLPDGFDIGAQFPNFTEFREPLCSQESASMVKMMGLAGSFLTDATGSCVGTKFAGTRCGASVFRTLAALAALIEIWSNMHLTCDVRKLWFLCGRDQRFTAETVRVLILAVTTAALNCGLDPKSDQWSATSPVAMPRFFTFP